MLYLLPAFYLTDMLSRHIFDPYAGLFVSIIAPLFLETYQQVVAQFKPKKSRIQGVFMIYRI